MSNSGSRIGRQEHAQQVLQGVSGDAKEAIIDHQINRIYSILVDLEQRIDSIYGDLIVSNPVDPNLGELSCIPPRSIGTIEQELGSIFDRINDSMGRLHDLHCNIEPMVGRIKLLS
jgi:hypothetical protein